MSEDLQQKYIGLKARLDTLTQESIARSAQKEERERHRLALVKRLMDAGIDTDNLETEKERLEKAIAEQLEAFEKQIATAEQEFQNTRPRS